MPRTRFQTILSIVFAALLISSAVAPTAIAANDGDSTPLAEFTVSDENSDSTGILAGILKGLGSRSFDGPKNFITDILDKEPKTSTQANKMQSFVNDHNQSFVNHTNTVFEEYNASVRNATYVLELTVYNVEGSENHTATKYAVVTADGENLTSGRIVNETEEPVNASKALTVFQAESLNKDLREYHSEYVMPGEIPGQGYYVELAIEYASVSEIEVNGSEEDT